MSVPTVTASRIYAGQAKGIMGERNALFMERFPYVGLSKVNTIYSFMELISQKEGFPSKIF